MNFKRNVDNLKKNFQELWKNRIFQICILVHTFYYIISQILTLTFFRSETDFSVYYAAGKYFLYNITDLYTTGYMVPFRYFPISAALFVPFYLMGFELGFIVFNLINFSLNILICIFIYKIVIFIRRDDIKSIRKDLIAFICIFLLGLPNLFNYFLGQINLYPTLLILISLYLFFKYQEITWNLLASFILGLSIIIKPTTFLLIPFLLLIRFDLENKKIKFDPLKSVVRIIGVLIPLLISSFLFILYPVLWHGFLDANFTGYNPIAESFSFSISQLITNFYLFYNIPYNQIIILLSVFIIIGGIGYTIFIFRRFENNSILYGYVIGIIITLLVYFDSWDHHLLNLIPLLIIIIFDPTYNSHKTLLIKTGFIFLSFFSLLFTGIWCLIYPLFPYNFGTTIFLIFIFYAISKYCLTETTIKIMEG
ncbi:MAG: glycosyltransferase family 87 protein [Candidatus Thorarchaeota archaeon]